MPRPKSAVTMGRPMATTEPNASSMMIMAAVMPMPSLAPGEIFCTEEIGLPPRATWNPGRAADCALSMTALIAPGGRSDVCSSNCTTA